MDVVGDIIDEIDRRISLGLLVPGQRLVEAELEQALGVGRVPIREAIRILAGEGAVEIVRGKGARLRSTDDRSVLEIVKVLSALTNAAIIDFVEGSNQSEPIANLTSISDHLTEISGRQDALSIMRGIGRYNLNLVKYSGNAFLGETVRKLRLHLYHVHLIRAVGEAALGRCGRRYAALTAALARRDRQEALEQNEFIRDTLLAAARKQPQTP